MSDPLPLSRSPLPPASSAMQPARSLSMAVAVAIPTSNTDPCGVIYGIGQIAHKPLSHVRQVEAALQQTVERAQHQRAVIRPSARRLVVRAKATHFLYRITLAFFPAVKLDRHAERIADHRSPKSAKHLGPDRYTASFHEPPKKAVYAWAILISTVGGGGRMQRAKSSPVRMPWTW